MADAAVVKAPGGKKKMILGVVIGAVVAGGGASGAFLFLGKKSAAAETVDHGKSGKNDKSGKHGKLGKHSEPGPIEKLNTFVVNLRDATANRYLKTTVEIELGDAKDIDKFKKYIPEMRHEVLMYLSNLSVAEIQGEGGKQLLAKELLEKLRKVFEAGEVKKLFFTEFVIQ